VDVDKYATRNAICKLITCLENLEISGNLTAAKRVSGKILSGEKPFMANFKFGTTSAFAGCLACPVVRILLLVKSL